VTDLPPPPLLGSSLVVLFSPSIDRDKCTLYPFVFYFETFQSSLEPLLGLTFVTLMPFLSTLLPFPPSEGDCGHPNVSLFSAPSPRLSVPRENGPCRSAEKMSEPAPFPLIVSSVEPRLAVRRLFLRKRCLKERLRTRRKARE